MFQTSLMNVSFTRINRFSLTTTSLKTFTMHFTCALLFCYKCFCLKYTMNVFGWHLGIGQSKNVPFLDYGFFCSLMSFLACIQYKFYSNFSIFLNTSNLLNLLSLVTAISFDRVLNAIFPALGISGLSISFSK